MCADANLPRLYGDLAAWWPLLSAKEDYEPEAAAFRALIDGAARSPVETMLELGSGGGNNAYYLKRHYRMTLVDLAPEMLAVSRAVNPDCEHVACDMRTVRLTDASGRPRPFDAVFVHDAIMYATTLADLQQTMQTAAAHCRPGGVALFAPDYIRETFQPATESGGHDGEGRALRYFSWMFDPDPGDTTVEVAMVYLLREGADAVRVEHELHRYGIFSRDEWAEQLHEAGFAPQVVTDAWKREVFVCIRGE